MIENNQELAIESKDNSSNAAQTAELFLQDIGRKGDFHGDDFDRQVGKITESIRDGQGHFADRLTERDFARNAFQEAARREGRVEELVTAINQNLGGTPFQLTLDYKHEGRIDVELRTNGQQTDEIQCPRGHHHWD